MHLLNYEKGRGGDFVMYKVFCLNLLNMAEFEKEFQFYQDFIKFIHKCKYSKKIKIKGWCKY